MTTARRLYRLHLALSSLALAAALTGAAAAVGASTFTAPSAETLASACQSLVPQATLPQFLALALAALALVVLVAGARSLVRQLRASRRYLSALPLDDDPLEIAGGRCCLIEDSQPRALCAGYLRPRIYLSTGTLGLLPEEELRAVVAHEKHHAERHDPLRLLVARALADALFFLPALRRMSGRYAVLSELAADQAAVTAASGEAPLASALLRFGEHGPRAATSFGISPDRVDSLAGDQEASRWQIPRRFLAASAAASAGLLAAGVISHGAGNETISLPLVLAQSCMLLMGAGPALLALGAVAAVRKVRQD